MNPLSKLFGYLRASVRTSILAGSLFLLATASGCASTKIYHLNLDPTTYPVTLTAIANTAGAMGYQVTHLASAVNVRYDHETWIYYSLGSHDYSMAIVVTSDVASNQVSARIDEAKAKGEEIWSKVVASRQQTSQPTQPAAPHS
jgi:hypothetical protein